MRELAKEAAKVRRLKPTRYVLVTSVPLSAVNKDAIVALIGADMLTPSDVIGQEGLNNLLGQRPEIEGKHCKLWLASRAAPGPHAGPCRSRKPPVHIPDEGACGGHICYCAHVGPFSWLRRVQAASDWSQGTASSVRGTLALRRNIGRRIASPDILLRLQSCRLSSICGNRRSALPPVAEEQQDRRGDEDR